MLLSNCAYIPITPSPPYLNAIDYMRGHRLSLVWLGFRLCELRNIRSTAIGAEKAAPGEAGEVFIKAVDKLKLQDLDTRNLRMLDRYFRDLSLQLAESKRVLKKGGSATYVIGNSNLKGVYIPNNEFLKLAGEIAGLSIADETIREIPNNRRYLPISVKSQNSLASRMRTEHIIELIN